MSEQNISNHAKVPTTLMAIAGLVVLTMIVFAAGIYERAVPLGVALTAAGGILLGFAVVCVGFMARIYSLTIQDRIIRLEMEVRLARLLPADLQERARNLDLAQRISLRFASDAELADLVRKVLDGNIKDRKAIKKLVKNWQADHQRV